MTRFIGVPYAQRLGRSEGSRRDLSRSDGWDGYIHVSGNGSLF